MTGGLVEIMNAPWVTVLTLAAGYAGYFVAHVGLRDHHQPMDQLFRVVLYGFWGVFAYMGARAYLGLGILSASALCMTVTILLGAFWQRGLRDRFTKLMRRVGVSHSDDLPTAWMAIAEVSPKVEASQLSVILTDGTSLFCDDLARFRDMPNGPCILGGQGDVLLYVTHIGRRDQAGKMAFTESDWVSDSTGHQITWVPRDNIARITLRRSWRK